MSVFENILPSLGRSDYAKAAGLGAAAGATGSLAGQALGLLDAPRRALWGLVPGLHDADTAEAYTGEQLAHNLLDVDPDSLGGRIGGVLLSTLLDPLTFAAGPLGGVAGRRGALALERSGLANRAAANAAGATEALRDASAATKAAAAAVPDYSKIVGAAGKEYPTAAVREALSSGGTGALRRYGGVSGLGTTVKRPPSQFLVDQLERQGFGSSILDAAGQPTDKFLLASDPATRSMFAPRGGRLMQVAEVSPEARGPLAPLFHDQPPMPTVGGVLGGDALDELSRKSPLLDALLQEHGVRYADLPGVPADVGTELFGLAADQTGPAVDSIRQSISKLPLERLLARLRGNAIGV